MPHELPPLPWAPDALAPVISKATIDKHYGAHHKAYVTKTNELAVGKYADMSLEELIKASAADGQKGLFNNCAQVYNHTFYWESLSPNGGAPEGDLLAQINRDFGDVATLKKTLSDRGVAHFASGWVWLVHNGTKLEIIDLHDADCPVLKPVKPLLTLDVWEHAYYIDYQNLRKAYLDAVVEKIDWKRAAARLAG